ncbi:MAG: short-chain dehydrogenase [Candidatus Hydrogenedentota bacterium]
MAADKNTVVILGATSGMAHAVAGEFARRGHPLVLAARNVDETWRIAKDLAVRHNGFVHAAELHAENYDSHSAFVEECARAAPAPIEGVVLCFGFMDEPAAQKDFAIARRTIEVNFLGAVSLLNLFADQLEAKRSGWIAAISSVAGDRGRQSNYIYGASKAGLSAYLQGLRNRLHHAGVAVITIKPGFVDTRMTSGIAFGPIAQRLVASPDQAGRAIYAAIAKRKNVAYVLWFWQWIMLIIKSIPEFQFKKMKL